MTSGMIIVMEIYLIVLLTVIDLIVCLVKAIGRRDVSQRSFKAVVPNRIISDGRGR